MKITMNNVYAIFNKEIKDVLKNGEIILLFLVYPLIAFIISSSIQVEGMPKSFFIVVFAVMHVIFTPIVVTTTILSEEKEKSTLRILLMNNVSPIDYLLSIGGFVFISTMLTSLIFLLFASFALNEMFTFLFMMSMGTIISILIGMIIGGMSKSQMAGNGMAVPIGMFFAFLPMLASFNVTFKSISIYTYSGIISEVLSDSSRWTTQNITVLVLNVLIFIVIFFQVFKANSLDT